MRDAAWSGHDVLLVYDWWDTAQARDIGRLHNPVAGIIVLSVPPPGRWFDRDIIEELFLSLGRPGNAQPTLPVPPGDPLDEPLHLLEGSGARDVLLYRAQWMPPQLLLRLMDVAAAADARLWLLCQPHVSDELTRAIDPCVNDPLSWESFWPAWHARDFPAIAPAQSCAPRAPRRSFPPVPDSDVTHFLPAAKAALPARQYARIVEEFAAARQVVRLGLRHDLSHAITEGSSDLATTICQWLAADVLDPDLAVSLCRLRGAQAELLRAGWHLDVNLGPFIDAHSTLPVARHHPDEAINALARTWRSVPGVVGPLLVALGIPEDHTWHVTLRDIARASGHISALGCAWPIPSSARPLRDAALLARQDTGAAPDDPLLTLPFLPPAPRTLYETVDEPWRRLNILVGRHAVFGDVEPDRRRMQRFGLHLTQLPLTGTPIWRAKAAPTRQPRADPGIRTASRRLVAGTDAQRRRLNPRDAHLLSHILRGRPLPVHDGSVLRALAGMRAAGLLDRHHGLSTYARLALCN